MPLHLFAKSIEFIHPITKEEIYISAYMQPPLVHVWENLFGDDAKK
jgi:hypothetical protein